MIKTVSVFVGIGCRWVGDFLTLVDFPLNGNGLVVHGDGLHRPRFLNGERDTLGLVVPAWGHILNERVGTRCESIDTMGLTSARPLLNDFNLIVEDAQLGSFHLLFVGDIPFGDLDFCVVVFYGHGVGLLTLNLAMCVD